MPVGAPLGNNNSGKGRRWAQAIKRAVDAYPERAISLSVNRGIDNAAYELVHKMMVEKDLGFFKEFGDRMDGKAAQALIGGDDDDNPIQIATRIELVDLDGSGTAKTTEET